MAKQKKKHVALEVYKSASDTLALWISDLLGSLAFLITCLSLIIIYLLWNMNVFPGVKAFDPYPFGGLDTILSTFAIILTVSVLISQNRQRRLEKVREQVEFEVNVHAEKEITKILQMLHDIQHKLHIDKPDSELEEMKETLDLTQLHKDLDEQAEKTD